MAEDKRWWKKDEDSDSSKEDVEDMLNEAEAKRLQREEELAEAKHREKMAEFTDPAPSSMKESKSGDGSPVEFTGQRLVLKPDSNGCFYVTGSIANIANLRFLVDTGASFCSVPEKLGVIDTVKTFNLKRGETVETTTAAGPGMGYRTTLPDITIGQMSIKNVDALINPLRTGDSEYCILGMTFLEHIDWKHDDGVLILNPDGESDGTKVYGGSGSEHWLLEDPGYTVAAIILALGLIATAFMGVAAAGAEDEWAETEAEVLEKYPGYDWVEHKDCYTDDWGDEYCDYWYDLDCWADLDVSYSVDNTSYSAEVDHFPIRTYDDYEGADEDCLDYVDNTMPIGSFVTLYYNIEDPSEVRIDSGDSFFPFFFCGVIQFILLIVVLLLARFDVGTGGSVTVQVGGFNVGGRYYDDPGYYDRPWHRRPWFHRRRHYHRHRSHRRSSSRVTRSSGGRRSGGGSSGGGGRSGGGRSGGGGRGR